MNQENTLHVPFSQPDINQADIDIVTRVLKSGILSMGEFVTKFEAAVAEYVGVEHAIAVSSGTAGLHIAVLAAELSEYSEIITTPFSFIPSANSILFGGHRPTFVDIELETLGPDPKWVENHVSEKTAAILFADLFHQAVNVTELSVIAEKNGLLLIEDACEAIGAKNLGTAAGALGDIGVFGFYPNKQITTGEGGMVVTNNTKFAQRCRTLRNQGRAPQSTWLTHDSIGFNFRLDEMSAALGYSQLARIESFLGLRQQAADQYFEGLSSIEGITLPKVAASTDRASWFAFTIQLDARLSRTAVRDQLHKLNIATRDYFHCIHLQKPYRELFSYRKGQFPVAERFAEQNLALPMFAGITREQIEYVCASLESVIARCQ